MEYRREGGALVSVLLEVNRYLDGETPTYGHLHIGREIQSRCDASTIVAKGSNDERLLLKEIEELRHLAPTGARENTMHWLINSYIVCQIALDECPLPANGGRDVQTQRTTLVSVSMTPSSSAI
jgi:hypothetical protein